MIPSTFSIFSISEFVPFAAQPLRDVHRRARRDHQQPQQQRRRSAVPLAGEGDQVVEIDPRGQPLRLSRAGVFLVQQHRVGE